MTKVLSFFSQAIVLVFLKLAVSACVGGITYTVLKYTRERWIKRRTLLKVDMQQRSHYQKVTFEGLRSLVASLYCC